MSTTDVPDPVRPDAGPALHCPSCHARLPARPRLRQDGRCLPCKKQLQLAHRRRGRDQEQS